MAQITPFPRKTAKDVDLVADAVRNWLAAMTADDVLIDKVAARMKLFIETYADTWFEPTFNLAVPATLSPAETAALFASVEKGVDQAAEQVNETISKIIIERLQLEVQIYEMMANSPCRKAKATAKRRSGHRRYSVVPTGDISG